MYNGTQKKQKSGHIYRFLKRLGDIVLSLALTVLFAPLSLLILLLIFLRDPGNPFYVQKRVGRGGRDLKLLKFRTMRKNAVLSPQDAELYRKEYKLPDDPRLIGYKRAGDGCRCFGAILRRTSMDELPQLWYNVLLRGNMSLVGPRPVLRDELARYYSEEEQDLLLSAKPGVTGYWQAYARNNALYQNGTRQKMELYYARHRSFWLDVKILLRTVVAVFAKTGAK